MRPLYLIYDSKVSQFERMVAEKTIKEAAVIFNNRKWYDLGDEPVLNNTKAPADVFVNHAEIVRINKYGPQRDAFEIWQEINRCRRMRMEPFVCVFITSQDLTVEMSDRYLNYCFGYTFGNITIISTARIKDMKQKDEAIMIEGLIMHELGHIFYLTSGNREHTERKLGLHCTNPGCVMKQGLTREELYRNFKEAKAMHRYYCPECARQAKPRQC